MQFLYGDGRCHISKLSGFCHVESNRNTQPDSGQGAVPGPDTINRAQHLDARNFRLMKTPVGATSKENWEEIIPHREDVYLSDIELFNDYLVVAERKEGLMNLRVIEWESGNEHYLDFGEEVYVARISTNPEFNTRTLRYAYSSLTTPSSTFDYDMHTRDKELKKQEEVLGGFDSKNYEAKRIYANADDGTKIPMFLVHRKDLALDGTNLADAEPKRLRYCLLHTAARIGRTSRRTTCRLAANWPWTPDLVTAFDRVHQLRLRC